MQTIPPQDFFRREIILILVFKAVLIFGLWYAFFSHPLHKTLTGDDVSQVLLGSSPAIMPAAPQ